MCKLYTDLKHQRVNLNGEMSSSMTRTCPLSRYFWHVLQVHRSSGTTLSTAGCSISRIVCTICTSQLSMRGICSCEWQQIPTYLADGHACRQDGTWLGTLILVQSLATAGAHTMWAASNVFENVCLQMKYPHKPHGTIFRVPHDSVDISSGDRHLQRLC